MHVGIERKSLERAWLPRIWSLRGARGDWEKNPWTDLSVHRSPKNRIFTKENSGTEKTQQLNFSGANLDGRPYACTSLVRAAKPHRYRLISFFQVDGPEQLARRSIVVWGTSGSAVRRLEVAVRRSAGALAATRQQSHGCAYSCFQYY